jgi:hypothetical protein
MAKTLEVILSISDIAALLREPFGFESMTGCDLEKSRDSH